MSTLRHYIREVLEGTLGGKMVDLYHFCTDPDCYPKPETLVVEPGRMSPTERRRSGVLRSYFYPDTPQHAFRDRPDIRNGALYHLEVPANQIYDTTGKIMGQWANKYGHIEKDRMFNEIRKEFPAAYIQGESFPVVIFFEPVTARLVDESTKKKLMGQEAA